MISQLKLKPRLNVSIADELFQNPTQLKRQAFSTVWQQFMQLKVTNTRWRLESCEARLISHIKAPSYKLKNFNKVFCGS